MKAKTRVSGFHVSNKKPIPNEKVLFSGYLQVYDSDHKRWNPLRGKLLLFVDGVKRKEFISDAYGYFEVEYDFRFPRKYEVEVRFEGGPKTRASMAGMKVEVITSDQRRKITRLIRIFITLLLIFVISVSLLMIINL
jgi:hypothetical protein